MTQPRAIVVGHLIGHSQSPLLHGSLPKRCRFGGNTEAPAPIGKLNESDPGGDIDAGRAAIRRASSAVGAADCRLEPRVLTTAPCNGTLENAQQLACECGEEVTAHVLTPID